MLIKNVLQIDKELCNFSVLKKLHVTGGYKGQVQVIKKGKYECYECNQKKSDVKTYPGCTIRNTPSEPIHCIVWGKHLFNQLFGEPDPDQDVSPDTADPEAVADAGRFYIYLT